MDASIEVPATACLKALICRATSWRAKLPFVIVVSHFAQLGIGATSSPACGTTADLESPPQRRR